jgi:signal transduction histidine kinase
MPHVSKRFCRTRTLGRSYEGLGIGLGLVRELVALHGGTIDAQSEPGSGTTLTLLLIDIVKLDSRLS